VEQLVEAGDAEGVEHVGDIGGRRPDVAIGEVLGAGGHIVLRSLEGGALMDGPPGGGPAFPLCHRTHAAPELPRPCGPWCLRGSGVVAPSAPADRRGARAPLRRRDSPTEVVSAGHGSRRAPPHPTSPPRAARSPGTGGRPAPAARRGALRERPR